MGNTSSSNIDNNIETCSIDLDNDSPLPDDLIVPSYPVLTPPKKAKKRRLSPNLEPEAFRRSEHGDSREYEEPPQKKQKMIVAERGPSLCEEIAESDYTLPTRSTSPTFDDCTGATSSPTIIPEIASVTSSQGPLIESLHSPNDDTTTESLVFSPIPMPSQTEHPHQDEPKVDTGPVCELLSLYAEAGPLNSFSSIQISENLPGIQILELDDAIEATLIDNMIGQGADQIMKILELHRAKKERDTKEVGVETEADQDAPSVLISVLEEQISKLREEKEALAKAASKQARDLERSTFYIKTMRMKYEAQTAASREKLNNHIAILKRHQDRITKEALVNHANKDFLVRVKARLKDEMKNLANEKGRCDSERRRLDAERKENEEVRAKLRVKERNECWMYKKIQMRDKNFEDWQEEKKKWEKERDELGIEVKRLKAALDTSRKNEPATSTADPTETATEK